MRASNLGRAEGSDADGDTFVVESNGFNDQAGSTRGAARTASSESNRAFHRVNFGTQLDLTLDDPQTCTRPFAVRIKQHLTPDNDPLESSVPRMRRMRDARLLSNRAVPAKRLTPAARIAGIGDRVISGRQ